MPGTVVMRALVAVAPFICSVVAAQGCDPCASVVQLDLEALSIYGKYLCCDLTCESEYTVGCAISILPENCRSCYDWDDYSVAYDEPDDASLTPAPTERAPIVFLTSPPTERVDTFSPTSAPTEGTIDTFPPTSAPTGTRTSPTQSCSTEEEARCADISPAQQEALDSYDNGGKVIVCDPTCVDGVSDPIHCNYYGLGPLCRGCGACSSCTPCP